MRSACVKARREVMTDRRPMNSGMKPYETRSSMSSSSSTALGSVGRLDSARLSVSLAMSSLFFALGKVAPKPMPVCRVRARIVLSLSGIDKKIAATSVQLDAAQHLEGNAQIDESSAHDEQNVSRIDVVCPDEARVSIKPQGLTEADEQLTARACCW